MRLEKLIDIIMVNIFRKNFAGFIGLDCKFNPFNLQSYHNESKTN